MVISDDEDFDGIIFPLDNNLSFPYKLENNEGETTVR